MMDPDKIKAVQARVKSGFPAGEIKEELRRDGYTENEINACFPAHTYDMRSWLLIFGLVFSLWGLWVFVGNGNWLLLFFGVVLLILYARERKKQR